MVISLGKDERLVYAGEVTLHTPDGKPRPSVPQYMIVKADEADPAAVREIGENERLVYGGRIFTDRKRAEERFAAMKAGREQSPQEAGTPLYLVEDAASVNPATGYTYESERVMETLSKEFTEVFALHIRKEKALERAKQLRGNDSDHAGDSEQPEEQ